MISCRSGQIQTPGYQALKIAVHPGLARLTSCQDNNTFLLAKMSNFGSDSSISIDQDFFESGYNYPEQKEQPYGGYNYDPKYPDYGQSAQQIPTYNYPSATSSHGFYDSSTPYGYGGNLAYDYGASGPTTMSSTIGGGYGMQGSMKPRQTSEDYTSFEDEPPLLEGGVTTWHHSSQLNVLITI